MGFDIAQLVSFSIVRIFGIKRLRLDVIFIKNNNSISLNLRHICIDFPPLISPYWERLKFGFFEGFEIRHPNPFRPFFSLTIQLCPQILTLICSPLSILPLFLLSKQALSLHFMLVAIELVHLSMFQSGKRYGFLFLFFPKREIQFYVLGPNSISLLLAILQEIIRYLGWQYLPAFYYIFGSNSTSLLRAILLGIIRYLGWQYLPSFYVVFGSNSMSFYDPFYKTLLGTQEGNICMHFILFLVVRQLWLAHAATLFFWSYDRITCNTIQFPGPTLFGLLVQVLLCVPLSHESSKCWAKLTARGLTILRETVVMSRATSTKCRCLYEYYMFNDIWVV